MEPSLDSPPASRSRSVLLVLLFALTFAVTTWALGEILPGGEGQLLSAKLDVFEEAPADEPYEVVFVGSSRIYHGVAPEVFDQRLKERGYPLRSFNLAITGQKVDGAYGTLESLAQTDPDGLKFVFIDPEELSLMLNRLPRTMRGVVYLHDVQTTRLLLDYVWNSELSFENKFDRSVEMTRACVYRNTNVGRALGPIDDLLGRTPTEEDMAFRLGPDRDGWRSKDIAPKPRSAAAHQEFLDEPVLWAKRIAQLRGKRPKSEPLHEHARPLLTRIQDLVHSLGAEPIFFISPATAYQGQLIQAHAKGDVKTLFRFNDPIAYPELYEMDARWEAAHLSGEGARRFSILLADRFADWLDARQEDSL